MGDFMLFSLLWRRLRSMPRRCSARATSFQRRACRVPRPGRCSRTRRRPTRRSRARARRSSRRSTSACCCSSSSSRSASVTAIYLEEYADKTRWYNRLLEINIQNLAAVPSIVYGILGLAFLVRGLGLGRVLLAGAMILTLLVLPTVIIAAREAIRSVPDSIRQGGYALGATQWQVVSRQVLPAAIPGIATGSILALSRAIGETAPLIMIGAVTYISFDPTILGPFTALPIQIYSFLRLPQAEFKLLAAASIIVLLVILLTLNAFAIFIRNRYRRTLVTTMTERASTIEPMSLAEIAKEHGDDGVTEPRGRLPGERPRRLLQRQRGDPRRQPERLPQRRHRLHRPVRLRQEHADPLLRPHERPRAGREGRGRRPLPRRRSLRTRRRPGRGAAPDRHGLPEAEPVPEVDLRQRRLRAARARPEGRPGRSASSRRSSRRRSGTRSRIG